MQETDAGYLDKLDEEESKLKAELERCNELERQIRMELESASAEEHSNPEKSPSSATIHLASKVVIATSRPIEATRSAQVSSRVTIKQRPAAASPAKKRPEKKADDIAQSLKKPAK